MSSLDDYTKAVRTVQNAKANKKEHPKGWEPGVVLDGGKSYVASGPVKSEKEARKKWDHYIELLGFPADEFEIIEPLLYDKSFTFKSEAKASLNNKLTEIS